MARASDVDIAVAMDLCNWLGELSGGFEPPLQEGDDQPPFDQDDDAACGRVLRRMLERAEQGSLMRVVWGMATVLNPENKVLDPDADVLRPHPDIAAAASELEEVVQALGRWKPLTASVGAAVNELVNELKAASAVDEKCWLIELPKARVWLGECEGRLCTATALGAIRFARQSDADAVVRVLVREGRILPEDNPTATEHLFVNTEGPAAPQPTEGNPT